MYPIFKWFASSMFIHTRIHSHSKSQRLENTSAQMERNASPQMEQNPIKFLPQMEQNPIKYIAPIGTKSYEIPRPKWNKIPRPKWNKIL